MVNFGAEAWVGAQILSSCEEGIVLGDWSNHGSWSLIDSSNSESLVDVGDKLCVFEETLGVVGAVLVSNSLKFVISQVVVELREDRFELSAGNSSLSKLVKVTEILLNTDSLLND